MTRNLNYNMENIQKEIVKSCKHSKNGFISSLAHLIFLKKDLLVCIFFLPQNYYSISADCIKFILYSSAVSGLYIILHIVVHLYLINTNWDQ